ncbi:retrovirus-related pol polyprotein from transposon TNT 1-94 [Tanacetum coccineum]
MSRSLYKNLKDIKEQLIEEVQEILNIFESMEQKVNEKSPTEILLQNKIDRLLEVSLTSEIQNCVLLSTAQQKHDLLNDELEKSSSDSKEIQANLINRIKILENDFQRSQAQSIDFELKLQHQKEKMTCDAQNQKEVDELIQCLSQKTYAYGDVGAKNQDLLMTISELTSKLRKIKKGKNVNTKFDSFETLGKRVYVTPFNKNITDKDMNASNTKINSDRSKQVTLQSTPKPEQGQKYNKNVITRGMYKINKQDTKSLDIKANTNVSNSTGVGSSHSVKRSTSKDNKSKNSILKNTKSSSTYVWNTSNSDCLDSNNFETKASNVCQTNACLSNSMTVKVIQLVLWIVDSGCSKHMTGNLQLLRNFVKKFMGTIRFGKDHFTIITGYGDYVQGNLTICHGDDLLTGSRDSNFYTISISEMAASSPMCLMSRTTSTKSWLWHRRLSHLNFGTINQLTSNDLVDGLPKFKYTKDHLYLAYEQGKSEKASLPPKLVPSAESKLELLHMDLCGPIRVASINGKKYILVIVDDYSRKMKRKADIEYYATSSQEVSDDSAANTTDNEHTSSSSSIVVDQDDAPQLVSSSDEQVATAPNSPVMNEVSDEFVQEEVADFDGNMFHDAPHTPKFEIAESSSTYQDRSNMHQCHQQHRSTNR